MGEGPAPWFDVDKDGLAKLIEKRGKTFVIHELIQNAWDTRALVVKVTLTAIPNRPYAEVVVEDDDADGFQDLRHAFTLFAESSKKTDPSKRGRFNLGEKLVLALCEEAEIRTTKGAVGFNAKDGRWSSNSHASRRERGTIFRGIVRMTRAEMQEVIEGISMLLPPPNVETYFNGQRLQSREPLASLRIALPTEIADEEGFMRRTERITTVRIYEPRQGENATIYEMGIPIVETGDRWHVDVDQKVPLNVDRDNVPPAYLKTLRVHVLNEMHRFLAPTEMTETWVKEGTSDKRVTPEAVDSVMTGRFGEKRVAFDPSDPEANKLAVAAGYTVIHGGALSSNEWANVKTHGVVQPAGKVTPSPKPFNEEGEDLRVIPPDEWTPTLRGFATYVEEIGYKLIGRAVSVEFANDIRWPYSAVYRKANGRVMFNVGRLGKAWFEKIGPKNNELILHELAHEYASDHLSDDYYDALTRLGAKMTHLALTNPNLFVYHGYEAS